MRYSYLHGKHIISSRFTRARKSSEAIFHIISFALGLVMEKDRVSAHAVNFGRYTL